MNISVMNVERGLKNLLLWVVRRLVLSVRGVVVVRDALYLHSSRVVNQNVVAQPVEQAHSPELSNILGFG